MGGEVVVASNVAVASWDGDDTSEASSMVEPVTGLLQTPGRLSPVCWTRADSHRCVMRTPDTRDVGLDFSATRSPSLRRGENIWISPSSNGDRCSSQGPSHRGGPAKHRPSVAPSTLHVTFLGTAQVSHGSFSREAF